MFNIFILKQVEKNVHTKVYPFMLSYSVFRICLFLIIRIKAMSSKRNEDFFHSVLMNILLQFSI